MVIVNFVGFCRLLLLLFLPLFWNRGRRVCVLVVICWWVWGDTRLVVLCFIAVFTVPPKFVGAQIVILHFVCLFLWYFC